MVVHMGEVSHMHIVAIPLFSIAYIFCVIIYRLFFHPLARYPGPKLAAATKWYECYFDLLQHPKGQFIFEIERMHDHWGEFLSSGSGA